MHGLIKRDSYNSTRIIAKYGAYLNLNTDTSTKVSTFAEFGVLGATY